MGERIANEVPCLEGTTLKLGDFVWAENERPSSSSLCAEQGIHGQAACNTEKEMEGFPEVDLSLSDEELIPLLHSAAASWGFFRVFNHGVPHALMKSITAHALRFFDLPLSDKLAVRKPPVSQIGYTSITQNVVIKAWSEALQVMPGEDLIRGFLDGVPSLPDRASFGADLMEYFSLVGALAMRIIHLLFRGLDLEEAEIKAVFDSIDSSTMRINYYPACPVANLTYGSPPHRDYGGVAILHQDDVGGLQVLKDGQWVGVKPEKGYLIVNVGDLIQILSNARYKSVLHRSLVHSTHPRLSFVFFYLPPEERPIAPLSKLVTKDRPAKYKSFYMREYRSKFVEALKANRSPSLFFEEIREAFFL